MLWWTARWRNTFLRRYNSTDKLTVLESIDDAATVYMGSSYRMPTIDEIRELMNNTTQTFIDVDGNEYIYGTDTINIESEKLKGVRFTGSNGNSIFIPAAGSCGDFMLGGIGSTCLLWSSSSVSIVGHDSVVKCLHIYDGDYDDGLMIRGYGLPIRGVQL